MTRVYGPGEERERGGRSGEIAGCATDSCRRPVPAFQIPIRAFDGQRRLVAMRPLQRVQSPPMHLGRIMPGFDESGSSPGRTDTSNFSSSSDRPSPLLSGVPPSRPIRKKSRAPCSQRYRCQISGFVGQKKARRDFPGRHVRADPLDVDTERSATSAMRQIS